MEKLTKYEQEVIIIYNADEEEANLYTTQPRLIEKIKTLIKDRGEEIEVVKEDEQSISVNIPKDWIKIKPKKVLTEEEKKKAKERFEKVKKANPEKFVKG